MDEIVIADERSLMEQLNSTDKYLLKVLNCCGLPTDNVLVDIRQRKSVFKNLGDILGKLTTEQRAGALYLSKFIGAVSAGLFDAALNYLWDETVNQLRIRVSLGDVEFFYDLALETNLNKRQKLHTADDLVKLDESELIKGCRDIGLISDMGYKLLDHIKFMRNWASAAHPNQVDLKGLQLVDWLENCIDEVICLPLTSISIQINKLLENIKTNKLGRNDAREMSVFFIELDKEKSNTLVNGFFGIYTRDDTSEETRDNIKLTLPYIWSQVDEETKYTFGYKHATFKANGNLEKERKAYEFLDIVNGLQYLTDDVKIIKMETLLNDLQRAHEGFNNFYSEPSYAKELNSFVGERGKIPKSLERKFARIISYVFITNGNGIAWDAEEIYIEMIGNFNQRLAFFAVMSFAERAFASKLQFKLCSCKYLELLDLIQAKITSPQIKDIINDIKSYEKSLDNLISDKHLMIKLDSIKALYKD